MDDTIQREREAILTACLDLARDLLEEQGEFAPFGASLTDDGLVLDAVYGDGEDPGTAQGVDRLLAEHRSAAAAGRLRGCGTVLDVRVTETDGREHDAICVDVEHHAAEPVRCLLPYRRRASGAVSYGELVAVALRPEVFPGPAR